MAFSTPRTWVAFELVTAAIMNTHVRDQFNAQTLWTSFAPTWTGTITNPVLGNGSIGGHYIRAQGLVYFQFALTIGSTTTFGSGNWRFSLPVAMADAGDDLLHAYIDDVGTQHYICSGLPVSTTLLAVTFNGDTGTGISPTAPFTWATGDTLRVSGHYRATP
jgi:hypothetical protein